MFTIFRCIKTTERNFRFCTQLLNKQVSSFSTKYTPHAVKRKKSKAKDTTVSQTHITHLQFLSS